jgi:hypothetical protein
LLNLLYDENVIIEPKPMPMLLKFWAAAYTHT